MRIRLSRNTHVILAVVITYVISCMVFQGASFFMGMPTLIIYVGFTVIVGQILGNKRWWSNLSILGGWFWVLLIRLDKIAGFAPIASAIILAICLVILRMIFGQPKDKPNKVVSKTLDQYINRLKHINPSLFKPHTGGPSRGPIRMPGSTRPGSRGGNEDLPSTGIGIYGKPGAGLGKAKALFGEAKVNAGVLGEQETCAVLTREFRGSRNPVALVNSIQFAGSKTADVDHALISGSKVFLIDSKKYRDGTYMATSSNTVAVKSTDGKVRHKKVRMDSALANYRQILPSVKFPKSYVMIHTKGDVIPKEIGGVFFGSPKHVVSDIKQQIGPGAPSINRSVFGAINSRRK